MLIFIFKFFISSINYHGQDYLFTYIINYYNVESAHIPGVPSSRLVPIPFNCLLNK